MTKQLDDKKILNKEEPKNDEEKSNRGSEFQIFDYSDSEIERHM